MDLFLFGSDVITFIFSCTSILWLIHRLSFKRLFLSSLFKSRRHLPPRYSITWVVSFQFLIELVTDVPDSFSLWIDKYLFSDSYVPGSALDTGDTKVDKPGEFLALLNLADAYILKDPNLFVSSVCKLQPVGQIQLTACCFLLPSREEWYLHF